MTSVPPNTDADAGGGFVHDPRHRYSLELRPSEALDAHLRMIASQLEEAGLLERGASTAARFHPHLTLLRAATAPVRAAAEVAQCLADDRALVDLVVAATFGDGRIVHVVPDDRVLLDRARALAIDAVAPDELDPLVLERDWTPHVTLAYAVPEPARADALAHVAAALPVHGRWAHVDAWDLDVRPTRLVERVPVPHGG